MAGIGKLGLVDDDKIRLSNLNRQTLFTEKNIGMKKVHVLHKKIQEINNLGTKFSTTLLQGITGSGKTIVYFEKIKENLNLLEDILDAISTIDEVTKKTVSKVLTLGELLSSKILYDILVQKGFDINYVNSKDLIFTKEVNENEVLDGDKSSINIKNNLDFSNIKMIFNFFVNFFSQQK